jgi:hypothetical protein
MRSLVSYHYSKRSYYDVKDSYYEELEIVFDKFPKYHMKISL